MFILHCHIGCRISDFINFTTDNVSNGYLSYIPTKTIGENDNAITIKLTQTANSIIEKYKSDENILFPFISKPKYNKYLKELCKAAGLTRSVQILQNKQPISKPLHETVSAHTARKTFINILYSNGVKNEIIASMSGHVEDSKAFFRYRKIDQDLKDKALASIE